MPNSKQTFVISCITREQIAEDLNNYLDAMRPDDRNVVEFAPDDKRLTKKACQAYADFLYTIDDDNSNDDERRDEYLHAMATNLGADMTGLIDD